jgi:uncharacterized membrane protein (UPF0127 family)
VLYRFGLAVSIFCLIISCRSPKKEKPNVIQPEPTKINLVIKQVRISVEVANNPEDRATGLMFRSALEPDQGMLFVFDEAGIYPFYMKNTKIPLSIAFIDKNGIIINIQQMTPLDEQNLHYSAKPFLFSLEVNQGWFLQNGIKEGDTVFGLPN